MLLAATTLRPQIVADAASLTLTNVNNLYSGNLIIETNDSFTFHVLSDTARTSNIP